MKKIMLAVAFICAAAVTQAAATNWKWSASDIIGSGNVAESTYTGTATLQYLAGSDWTDVGTTASVADGAIKLSTTQFSSQLFTAATDYTFRFVITDGDKTFTSSTKAITAQASDTASIKFGSQAGNAWQSVPEPTSGLLLILGLAGLALRRKQK